MNTPDLRHIVVEGWRFLPHSFAIVNQFQCLELARRPGIALWHRDMPCWDPKWKPVRGLLPEHHERRIEALAAPPPDLRPDAVLRMDGPFDFTDADAGRTVVFATSEFGRMTPDVVRGTRSPDLVVRDSSVTVITPSSWSRAGLIASGIPPERIHLVPHGVDTDLFRPATPERRAALRRQFGWSDRFVFLNVSALRHNKGIPQIIEALSRLVRGQPGALLMLKGLDDLYQSGKSLRHMMGSLGAEQRRHVHEHIGFTGEACSFAQMAALYQAADCYVSPYTGEGFNLPVLEALACGLPVICTGGGSTDDFASEPAARRIASHPRVWKGEQGVEYRVLEPDPEHLSVLMNEAIADRAWAAIARVAGPAAVAAGFTWRHAVDKLIPLLTGDP